MSKPFPKRPRLVKFGFCLAISQLLALAYGVYLFRHAGHLPGPLFYDVTDTFMDFYNTNFWSNMPGRYDEWHSIYPILTFWLGQLITPSQCSGVTSAVALRVCSPGAVGWLAAAYLLGAWICALMAARQLRQTGQSRWWMVPALTLMIFLSMPGLFALERGNYILIAFACLALSECSGRDWKGALFLALAINLKQYLVVLWFVPFIKRRFDYLLLSALFALAINTLATLFVVEYHYSMLFENMFSFSTGAATSYFEKMWYATSFSAWAKGVQYSPFVSRLPTPVYFALSVGVNVLRWSSLALVLASLVLCARNAVRLSWEELSFIVLLVILMATDSLGGYAIVLAFPAGIVLATQGRMNGLLPLIFILVTPFDIPLGPSHVVDAMSYLSGRHIDFFASLTVLAYLRPAALFLLLWCLVLPQFQEFLRSTKKSRSFYT